VRASAVCVCVYVWGWRMMMTTKVRCKGASCEHDSINFRAIAFYELIHNVRKLARSYNEFMSVFALEAMKFNGAPRPASCLERCAVEFIAQLQWNHPIIGSVHYHHRSSEFRNVLIALKSKAIIVNWLQNCELEPRQMSK